MSEWITKAIAELLENEWSGEWGKETGVKKEAATVFRSTDIDDYGHVRFNSGELRYIPIEKNKKLLTQNDIIIEASGGTPDRPVGRSAIISNALPERSFTSNFLRTFRVNAEFFPKFILWKLLWLHKQPEMWRFQQQTTGMININIPQLLSHSLHLPKCKDEQEKIAQVLDLIDKQIEDTKALIAKQENIRQGLMQDLFTRGVDETGQLRPAYKDAPHLYHETELGWLPLGWEVKSVDECVESLIDGPFGSNLKTEHYVNEPGVRVVRLQNIQEYEYDDTNKMYVSERHATKLARYTVHSGDILIASLGDDKYVAGRACSYPEGLPSGLNKADCFRLRADKSVITNRYMMLSLNSERSRTGLRKLTQGVTRQRINSTNYKRLLLAVPEIKSGEQQRVVETLEVASDATRALKYEKNVLRDQKAGLMRDLLSGDVSVEPLMQDASA